MSNIKIQGNAKGYMFNPVTNRLESYEPISAMCRISDSESNEISYKFLLGGEVKIESHPACYKFPIYESADDFEKGKAKEESQYVNLYIGRLISHDWGYKFKTAYDRQGNEVNLEDVNIVYDYKTKELRFADAKAKYYSTRERASLNNDYDVKEEDGTIVHHTCASSKIKLNDEQMKLMEELKNLLERIDNSNIDLFMDRCDESIYAFNTENVSKIEHWCESNDEVDVDVNLLDDLYKVYRICNTDSDSDSFVGVSFK